MSTGLLLKVICDETLDWDFVFYIRQTCRDTYFMCNDKTLISSLRRKYGLQDPLPFDHQIREKEKHTEENTYWMFYRIIQQDMKYRRFTYNDILKNINRLQQLCSYPFSIKCYKKIFEQIPEFYYIHEKMAEQAAVCGNRNAYSVFSATVKPNINILTRSGSSWFFLKTEELHPGEVKNIDRMKLLIVCLEKTSIKEYNNILEFYGLSPLTLHEITEARPTVSKVLFDYIVSFPDEEVTSAVIKMRLYNYSQLFSSISDRKLDWVKIVSHILENDVVINFEKIMLLVNNDIVAILNYVNNPLELLKKYYNRKLDWLAVAYWFKCKGDEENYYKAMFHTGYNYTEYNRKYG